MPRTLTQMLKAANATTTCTPGTCLHMCAEWWLDRPSGETDAYVDEKATPHSAWLAATKKVHAKPEIGMLAHWRHTPARSKVHGMASGHPGHIAPVVKIEKGIVYVRSTDMGHDAKDNPIYKSGSVATVPLHAVTTAMGLIFDGYSRDIAGVVVVPAKPKKKPAPKPQNTVKVDATLTAAQEHEVIAQTKAAGIHFTPEEATELEQLATKILKPGVLTNLSHLTKKKIQHAIGLGAPAAITAYGIAHADGIVTKDEWGMIAFTFLTTALGVAHTVKANKTTT